MESSEKFDYTEVFYICDPDKADTCPKTNCFRKGGRCRLTMNPDWGWKICSGDHGTSTTYGKKKRKDH